MQLLYHNIPVDNGDCHFIRLIDGEDQYVVMVDCGSFYDSVQALSKLEEIPSFNESASTHFLENYSDECVLSQFKSFINSI